MWWEVQGEKGREEGAGVVAVAGAVARLFSFFELRLLCDV
jgi:hypothetical protein